MQLIIDLNVVEIMERIHLNTEQWNVTLSHTLTIPNVTAFVYAFLSMKVCSKTTSVSVYFGGKKK